MRGASALLNKDIRPAKMSTPHSGKPLVADMSSSSLSVTLPPAFSGDAAFRYWLEDHEALRSPFPAYMRKLLQEHTFCHFMGWMFQPSPPSSSVCCSWEVPGGVSDETQAEAEDHEAYRADGATHRRRSMR